MGRLSALRGWRGKLACFVAGAATTLAFAPFHAWPVLFLTLPFLFLMLDKARHWRSAALYALAFGYGYCMAGTYWIANSLLVDADQFGWLVPFSVLGLSLVMAVWFALFGGLYSWQRGAWMPGNLLRFAVLWVVVEYLRSLGIFGFPWNLIGSAALAEIHVAQSIALFGTYGVGFLLLLLVLTPVLWLQQHPARRRWLAVALLGVAAAAGYGFWRLPAQAGVTDIPIRIVQGNIAQTMKWTPQGRIEAARVYVQLTQLPTTSPTPKIILWPETALPFVLREGSPVPSQVGQVLPPGAVLLTGVLRSEGEMSGYRLYNSIVAIDASGQWLASYDKHQLVPFGEFVPLRSVLPIDKITPGTIDLSRGMTEQTLAPDGLPALRPLVCYEAIFPWLSRSAPRAAWLFNATNDGWYGDSTGPYQHLDAARLRALEQGLPLARAANTGISALIDPYGRVLAALPLGHRGLIERFLPEFLSPTLYARTGEWLVIICLTIVFFVTKLPLFQRKK